ncbi:MAG: patatin-like phospholipase family protein [Spirochaetaceae bacterium]|nr:patatin-like phospholipase family protein [Spirochaetaceae bacterium]
MENGQPKSAGGDGYCLVLSGGGARGVYHIGVWRALRELGIEIEAFVGNSIGALVAAFLAQGLESELEAIGSTIGIDTILRLPPELVENGELKLGPDALAGLRRLGRDLVERKGLDTGPLRELLEKHIDESVLRASDKDLGIVAVDLGDLEPREFFLDAMEEGSLVDHLMASAAFPGFESPVIEGKSYVDGGLYDNIPYETARRRGYRKIIVVDVSGPGRNRRPSIEGAQTVYIKNSVDMGGAFDFDRRFLDSFALLGYLDALRTFGRLWGYSYFLESESASEKEFRSRASALDPRLRSRLLDPSGGAFPARMRYDRRLLLKLLECAASALRVERVARYDYGTLAAAIRSARDADEAKLAALLAPLKGGPPSAANRGASRHETWDELVAEALRTATLRETPYFYARLLEELPLKLARESLKALLETLVPEIEAAMMYASIAREGVPTPKRAF